MNRQNKVATDSNADRIRELNDQLRKTFTGGSICITRSISERCDIDALLALVREFDAFTDANDPFREHDFGALEIGGETVFWKIDYYANGMQGGSPDPTDPAVTERVLTIFLAEEN